jgi:peptidoglycan/xylan/chitin deacetylase (PgdA/CDA1 family)
MKKTPTKKKSPKKKSAAKRPQAKTTKKVIKKTPVTAKPLPLVVPTKPQRPAWLRFDFSFVLAVAVVLIIAAIGFDYVTTNNQIDAERQSAATSLSDQADETHLFYTKQLEPLMADIKKFESNQTTASIEVTDPTTITTQVNAIKANLVAGKLHQASAATVALRRSLATWQQTLSTKSGERLTASEVAATKVIRPYLPPPVGLQVPILVYHQTPTDFEQQLQALQAKGYTTITLAQLTAAWKGAVLPAKPVVITFDDGYANQMTAFNLLEQYHMKATFYIIDGGPGSDWCIGAGRLYNDPSQPAGGCGDAYLNWDQVRQLDQSGIITIGAHTIDHPDLPSETPDQQRMEIAGGKQQLEAQIGHSVSDFAYPYGDYDATTISIVQQAGFSTAVTTAAGTLQSAANRYTLPRVRDAYALP